MSKIKNTLSGIAWAYAVWLLLVLGYKIVVGFKESQERLEKAAEPYIDSEPADLTTDGQEALRNILGGLDWTVDDETGDWIAPDGTRYTNSAVKITAVEVPSSMIDSLLEGKSVSGIMREPQSAADVLGKMKWNTEAGLANVMAQPTHDNCDNGVCLVSEDGDTRDCPMHAGEKGL